MSGPRPPWLLVLVVLVLHWFGGRELQRLHEGWRVDGLPPLPARMHVEFVREMTLKAAQPVHRLARMASLHRVAAPPTGTRVEDLDATIPGPVQPPVPSSPASGGDLPSPETDFAAPEAPLPPVGAASAVADEEPGPEWPLSTRLSYELTGDYRGPVSGQAQVDWLRQGRDYQVHLDVGIGPSFAPLITRRMSSQGRLTPDGIAPIRYDEETRYLIGGGRRTTVLFRAGDTLLDDGRSVPALPGSQDSASQFVQLTWLFLTGREAPGSAMRCAFRWPSRAASTRTGSMKSLATKPWTPAWVWCQPGICGLPVRRAAAT